MANTKTKAEYWKKLNPEWDDERCEQEAKKISRRSNYQCIEYWQAKYPNATLEECKKMLAEHKRGRKSNHQCIEYWQAKYPNATLEECKKMLAERKAHAKLSNPINVEYWKNLNPGWSKKQCQAAVTEHARKNNYGCIEYWQTRYPDATLEECKKMMADAMEKTLQKRPDNSGENNPAHHSKTTPLQRKQRSPLCIEFWEKKYPNKTHEQHVKLWEAHKKKIRTMTSDHKINPVCWEHWVEKGYTMEEAIKKVSEVQKSRAFTLEKCIKKYGEIEGPKVFKERQVKWQKSLHKSFNNTGVYKTQSKISKGLFEQIINKGGYKLFEYEVPLGAYSFDLWVNGSVFIEFNGDYWHCNPKIYGPDYYNKTNKKFASEIWKRDKQKVKFAKSKGYPTLVIWELDYKKDPEKTIQKCIEFINENS